MKFVHGAVVLSEMYVLTEAFGGLSGKNPVRGGPGSFPWHPSSPLL